MLEPIRRLMALEEAAFSNLDLAHLVVQQHTEAWFYHVTNLRSFLRTVSKISQPWRYDNRSHARAQVSRYLLHPRVEESR